MGQQQSKNYTIGILLIVFGAAFLARNLDIIPYQAIHYIFNWYSWLIGIGLVILIKHPGRLAGLVLVSIGTLFLLQDLDIIPYLNMRTIWPLFLIGAGIYYLIRKDRYNLPKGEKTDGSMDFIDDTNLFGGGDVLIESQNFKGGKVSSVFGGGNYNLTKAKLAPGNKNVIEVFAMFGGSTFIVPPDWNVRVEVTPIFGGFTDKRSPFSQDEAAKNSDKELFITGFVMFGGGEVKN